MNVRYIDRLQFHETFLNINSIKDQTGLTICNSVTEFLKQNNLFSRIEAAERDGAPAMTGVENGFTAHFSKETGNKCTFVHCVAHRLNLAVMSVKSTPEVKGLCDLIYNLCQFLSDSPKRVQVLKDHQDKLNLKLIKPFYIRWMSSFDANERVILLFKEIVETLSDFKNFSVIAEGLLSKMCHFTTLLNLCGFTDILGVLKNLTLEFQKQRRVISSVNTDIKYTISCLNELISNGTFVGNLSYHLIHEYKSAGTYCGVKLHLKENEDLNNEINNFSDVMKTVLVQIIKNLESRFLSDHVLKIFDLFDFEKIISADIKEDYGCQNLREIANFINIVMKPEIKIDIEIALKQYNKLKPCLKIMFKNADLSNINSVIHSTYYGILLNMVK